MYVCVSVSMRACFKNTQNQARNLFSTLKIKLRPHKNINTIRLIKFFFA